MISTSLDNLLSFIQSQEYRGYDPYDTLNSPFDFNHLGRWTPSVAIQIQKRNPFNIRPLLGIKKERNPKGLGLLLKAFSILYQLDPRPDYKKNAQELYHWLVEHPSTGFSGICWGYNFDWANPGGYLPAYTPSIVVTAFVIDGIFEYYHTFHVAHARDVIVDSINYILNDLPRMESDDGICFAYTHQSKDCCYNASLLGAETLTRAWTLNQDDNLLELARSATRLVLSRQKPDGEWYYSFDPAKGTERRQIDFHQGFVLVSLFNYLHLVKNRDADLVAALQKGLCFYKERQFDVNGRSYWRLPKKWPSDIHHQAQGIITFSLLREFDPSYLPFARRIAEWTIQNMQDRKGYFYYQKHRLYTNRIPYMRWGQEWMLLALAELLRAERAGLQ